MSSSKKTKHIRHRFFLIKERVESGDVEIKYKPTGSMWSDILTKPKQGSISRKFRGHLMNVSEDYDDDAERLHTHSLLLSKNDKPGVLSTTDRNVPNKRPKVFFSHRILSSINEHYLDHKCEELIRIKKQESCCHSE